MNAAPSMESPFKIFTIRTDDFITLSLYDKDRLKSGENVATAGQLDLQEYFQGNKNTSFIIEMRGDSMIDANIVDGCKLVVDRSILPSNNCIVVVIVDGNFMVRRFIRNSSGVRLMPANEKYQPLPLTDLVDYQVWGVVTRIIIDTI